MVLVRNILLSAWSGSFFGGFGPTLRLFVFVQCLPFCCWAQIVMWPKENFQRMSSSNPAKETILVNKNFAICFPAAFHPNKCEKRLFERLFRWCCLNDFHIGISLPPFHLENQKTEDTPLQRITHGIRFMFALSDVLNVAHAHSKQWKATVRMIMFVWSWLLSWRLVKGTRVIQGYLIMADTNCGHSK